MQAAQTTAPVKTSVEKIDALTKRAAALNDRRTRVFALLEAEEQRAQEARRLAEETFGTSDLDALRVMYAEQQALYDQAWFDFEVELDQFDSALSQAEAALKSV